MIIRKITTEDRIRAIERLSQTDFFAQSVSRPRVSDIPTYGNGDSVEGQRWEQPTFANEEAITGPDPTPSELLKIENTTSLRPLIRMGRFVIYRTDR